MLKVITWNCNRAFRNKAKFIKDFKPDILVVPECEHPDKFKLEDRVYNEFYWFGDNVNQGLGVFSFTDFKIKLLDYHEETFKVILPLSISNDKESYTVFAICANNPQDRKFQYVGQIWKAINLYQDKLIKDRTLLIGDFNSNSIWDKPKREANHTTVVDILANKGIESTYHKYFEQKQGNEKHQTFFLYRHENKPYHIDYCFASKDMITRLRKVEVGEYKDWISLSDHMPVIVDFE